MTVEEELSQMKRELAAVKSSRKDSWDKMQVLTGLLIPLVIAFFAWIQNTNSEQARESSMAIQLKLDSLQNEREVLISSTNSKVGQVNLVSNFFEALLSKDEARKKLAIKSVLIALPDEGPDLVRIVSSSEDQPDIKNYAEASLNERRTTLIKLMYSDNASERIKGFTDLYAGWKNNTDIVPALMNYAIANASNANGVYNTLIFLGQMDKNALLPHSQALIDFSSRFDALGPKIKDRGQKLKARLK